MWLAARLPLAAWAARPPSRTYRRPGTRLPGRTCRSQGPEITLATSDLRLVNRGRQSIARGGIEHLHARCKSVPFEDRRSLGLERSRVASGHTAVTGRSSYLTR